MEKRFLLAGLLAASALMAACSDDDSSISQAVSYKQTSEIKPATYTGPRQIVLRGVASGEDGLQKTAIAQDGKSVLFSYGDKISLFDGTDKNCEFSSAVYGGGSASAEFSGPIDKEADKYYILYPYQALAGISKEKEISATLPAKQTATQGSFDPAANLSVAICDDGKEFTLKNVGSLLKFTTTEAFSRIVVRSNNTAGEGKAEVYPKIAGNCTITFDSKGTPGAMPTDDAVSAIELVPGDSNYDGKVDENDVIKAGTYYVALFSGILAKGLTIEFYNASGDLVSDTYKRFQKEITLYRSKDANCGKLLTANGVYVDMVFVKGGTFTMGAPDDDDDADDDEKPAHQVTLSDYSIGRFEVTQRLWKAVMEKLPSKIADESYEIQGADKPVVYVSWDDVKDFITELNTITGKKFRLPTEAEWEFAARGGTESQNFKYSGTTEYLYKYVWCNSTEGSEKVGSFEPNELGIYDMSGNVSEWCHDLYYDKYYDDSPESNPKGPDDGLPGLYNRAIRGGSWKLVPWRCRVSFRDSWDPGQDGNELGFRLVIGHGTGKGTHGGFDEFDI